MLPAGASRDVGLLGLLLCDRFQYQCQCVVGRQQSDDDYVRSNDARTVSLPDNYYPDNDPHPLLNFSICPTKYVFTLKHSRSPRSLLLLPDANQGAVLFLLVLQIGHWSEGLRLCVSVSVCLSHLILTKSTFLPQSSLSSTELVVVVRDVN